MAVDMPRMRSITAGGNNMYALNFPPKSNNRYLWIRYYSEKRLIDMNYERMNQAITGFPLEADVSW